MQIKTTLRFHLTPTQTTNVGEDAGKKELSYIVGGKVNLIQPPMEKSLELLKRLKIIDNSVIPLLGLF
jgi:hypothetical protein